MEVRIMAEGAERINEIARGFMPSRVLLSGFELGVFEALGDGRLSSSEVASKIGADARATDRLMNALVVLDLLVKDGDTFANSPDARESLIPGKPGFIGGLGHTANLWETWSTLTEAVRQGTSVFEREGEERAEFVKPFIAAMHFNSSRMAPQVLAEIDLADVKRLVDVGGGSGAYSIAFCRANPEIEAVVFDMPDVVPLTNEYAAQAGMSDRISTATGDFTVDELGRDFDLAFMSHILHSNSREENAELIKRAWRALKPGGQIVVQEFVVDEGRTSPEWSVLFALNMLVGTKAGDTYTEAEIAGWFADAGFVDVRRVDPKGTGTTLVMGRKG
jgi:precorrin-6B methylase 2